MPRDQLGPGMPLELLQPFFIALRCPWLKEREPDNGVDAFVIENHPTLPIPLCQAYKGPLSQDEATSTPLSTHITGGY